MPNQYLLVVEGFSLCSGVSMPLSEWCFRKSTGTTTMKLFKQLDSDHDGVSWSFLRLALEVGLSVDLLLYEGLL